MVQKEWWKYIEIEKIRYKKLGNIKCPAFYNEEVYFNYYGLNHLMYKNGILRTKKEIIERFGLIIHIPNILKKIKNTDFEEKRIKGNSLAYFWTIKYRLHSDLRIRIILRRLNNGKLHFLA